MHMRDTARQSIFSLPASQQHGAQGENFRSTVYSTGSAAGSEDEPNSANPLLHPSSASQGRASGLRHSTLYADDSEQEPSEETRDGEDEGLRHRGHTLGMGS